VITRIVVIQPAAVLITIHGFNFTARFAGDVVVPHPRHRAFQRPTTSPRSAPRRRCGGLRIEGSGAPPTTRSAWPPPATWRATGALNPVI
jgi:hypothetical protein